MKSVCRSGRNSSSVWVAWSPRPVLPPAPIGDQALVDLVARVAGVVARVQKAGEPFLLVIRARTGTPAAGRDDEGEGGGYRRHAAHHREVRPAHPSEEQNRQCDDHQHDSRAEVGLKEDQCRRGEAQGQHADGLAGSRAAAGALDHERREGDDQQHLGELRGLEAEVGELDPAAGAARGGPEEQDEADRGDHRRVDADPDLAEARVVDPGDGEHQRDPEHRVDRLAEHEVERLAGNVVAGGGRQGEDAEGDQPDRGGQQHPVEVGQVEALADRQSARAQGQWSSCSLHHHQTGRSSITKWVAPRRSALASPERPLTIEAGLDTTVIPGSRAWWDGNRRSDRQLEVVLEHPRGHRRRGVDAEAGPLDRHRDHDLRIVGGSERHVPGLVGDGGATLGGPRLAGDREGEVAKHRV